MPRVGWGCHRTSVPGRGRHPAALRRPRLAGLCHTHEPSRGIEARHAGPVQCRQFGTGPKHCLPLTLRIIFRRPDLSCGWTMAMSVSASCLPHHRRQCGRAPAARICTVVARHLRARGRPRQRAGHRGLHARRPEHEGWKLHGLGGDSKVALAYRFARLGRVGPTSTARFNTGLRATLYLRSRTQMDAKWGHFDPSPQCG